MPDPDPRRCQPSSLDGWYAVSSPVMPATWKYTVAFRGNNTIIDVSVQAPNQLEAVRLATLKDPDAARRGSIHAVKRVNEAHKPGGRRARLIS